MEKYLIRVYDDVEPKIVLGPCSDREFDTKLVEYLRQESYSNRDGLFMLIIKNNKPAIVSFSAGFLEECREKAGEYSNEI